MCDDNNKVLYMKQDENAHGATIELHSVNIGG